MLNELTTLFAATDKTAKNQILINQTLKIRHQIFYVFTKKKSNFTAIPSIRSLVAETN